MIINVLVCKADGTQVIEQREVPDDYFGDSQSEMEALRTAKLAEVGEACRESIFRGVDVETSEGVKHFSLTTEDQQNLDRAAMYIAQGAPVFPYHADGEICSIYPASDILAIIAAKDMHILYHTTYCNHLNVWVRRAESVDELEPIHYGAVLPDDLAESMAGIMAAAEQLREAVGA